MMHRVFHPNKRVVYWCACAGETEEQYLATEALVRRIGFDRVNTAAYSPRPNTPAAEWDNQVGPAAWEGG